MKQKKAYWLLSLFFVLLENSQAQDFEWLKTYGTVSGTDVRAISADTNGGCTALIVTSGTTTIYFDTIGFMNPNGTFLVKHDKNGKVTNARLAGNFFAWDICRDDSGNFYITGNFSGVTGTVTIGSTTMNISNGSLIFAKFSNDLKFVWAVQTGNIYTSWRRVIYSQGHLYFIGASTGTVTLGSTTYNFGTEVTDFFGELNPLNGGIVWSNYLHISSSSAVWMPIFDLLSLNGKLYISGNISSGGLQIASDTFYAFSGYVIRTDNRGKYEKRFILRSKNTQVSCITTDGEYLYIGGQFMDSLQWGTKKIAPEYASGSKRRELYSASITTSLQTRWFFHPKILDKNKGGSNNYIIRAACSNGYFYFSGAHDAKILIDSNTLNTSSLDVLVLKMDYKGNVLWATHGGGKQSKAFTLDAISNKYIFLGGTFNDTIKFGKYSSISKGATNGFVTKISNYFITRGQVKSGPYCAGDTIKIPYTKYGNFDSSNTFIAQLSDEYGNFETGYRELGRIKTNKDSTILGKLPLFQVASSKLYRIRILSTKPPVQSYYRIDTLRLLIYSRDKANPGPPDTICRGDTIQLNTYGGTKWNWSPSSRMDNSKARQPKVWPETSTKYRIIIGDSSGCGAIDTGYKQIFVSKSPKAFLDFNDTVVCSNYKLSIPVQFRFGDSTAYSWKWYFVNSPSSFFFLKSGNSFHTDTVNYTPSVEVGKSEKLALVISDGCSNKKDTVSLNIRLKERVEIVSKFSDTTLCTGNLLKYKATATGGVTKQYRYQWKDLVSNSILSTTDSLKILTKKALKIQLIVNDGCEALGDTAFFEVKVKAELKAITNLRDTTICAAKPLNYTATATGGTGKNYKFYWLLNNKQIDTVNHLQLTLNNSSTLSLITTDNCSLNDTVKKTITVNPSPKADFSWDLACSRTVTKFQFTGSKPNSPITTTFHWNFNNESPSYLENPSYLFTLAGTKKISLATTSSNGCTDTVKKDVVIKPQSKADFTATDVCETDSAVFINKSQDATGYNWKFGDGQTSKLQTSKHKYNITSTTTYNVTLVAQVANGCSDSISKAITINKNPSSDFSYTYNGIKVDLKITKAGNAYQWKFGTTDSFKTSATTYSHTIKSSDQTKVCLTATDISGCSSQTCKNVSVGILKVLKSDGFKLYPNPNTGNFTIEIENPVKDVSIEIFNLLGERVKKVERAEKVTLIDLDVAEGMYWVRVKNGNLVWNQKILVSSRDKINH